VPQVAVRGGPFDGQDVAVAGTFRWISPRGGHGAPASGRALYRLRSGGYDEGRRRERGYEYLGDAKRWCEDCRLVVAESTPPHTCEVCGTETKPAYWPDPQED